MASNPMQRKSRLSFVMGAFMMTLILGIVIIMLLLQMGKQKQKEAKVEMKEVYALKVDVKSGQAITMDMCKTITVNSDVVPLNSISSIQTDLLKKLNLQDKQGNPIIASTGEKGETKLALDLGNNRKVDLTPVEGTDNYSYKDGDNDVIVEPVTVPLIAKVDMKANTVITSDLVAQGNSELETSAREEEYNMITLPSDLVTNDYIDIRLLLPTGQNFLVMSKKQVTIPGEDIGAPVADTIKITLNEAEIKTMSNAIVDAYRIQGSKLYAVKYTDGGIQGAITADYMPSGETVSMMDNNPAILGRAKSELLNRIKNGGNTYRESVLRPAIESAGEEGQENAKSKIEESITKSQSTRQSYLDGLANAAPAPAASASPAATQ